MGTHNEYKKTMKAAVYTARVVASDYSKAKILMHYMSLKCHMLKCFADYEYNVKAEGK